MTIDLYEKEVKNAQSRFNETFGALNVCNLQTRQKAILTIIGMARLAGKIRNSEAKNLVKDEVNNFIRKKEFLNQLFNEIDKYQKERRKHETSDSRHQEHGAYATGIF